MSNILRMASMMAALLGVVVTAMALEPELNRELGVDTRYLVLLATEVVSGHKVVLGPDERDQAIFRRIQEKYRVVDDLLAGRLTFLEAAALFRRLNEEQLTEPDRRGSFGESEDEKACKQVIQWVRVELRTQSPEKVNEVVARFEKELRRHKEEYGIVVLPKPVVY